MCSRLQPCARQACSSTTYYVLTMAGVLLDAPHIVTVVAQSDVRLLSIHKVDIFSVGDAGVIERLTQVPALSPKSNTPHLHTHHPTHHATHHPPFRWPRTSLVTLRFAAARRPPSTGARTRRGS